MREATSLDIEARHVSSLVECSDGTSHSKGQSITRTVDDRLHGSIVRNTNLPQALVFLTRIELDSITGNTQVSRLLTPSRSPEASIISRNSLLLRLLLFRLDVQQKLFPNIDGFRIDHDRNTDLHLALHTLTIAPIQGRRPSRHAHVGLILLVCRLGIQDPERSEQGILVLLLIGRWQRLIDLQ